jgi:hypothetical protein
MGISWAIWSAYDADLAREGIPAASKVTNPSLGHLASYARIAIQISKISRERRWSQGFCAVHAQ